MATREQKMQVLINTLGFDEAMKLAPGLTDDATGDSEADKAAKEAADEARAASKNPFIRGEHFSLAEQARLYRNPKTRDLAIRLAAKAGTKLKAEPTQQDLHARSAQFVQFNDS